MFTALKWGNEEKTMIICTREDGAIVSSPYPPTNWMAEEILKAEDTLGVAPYRTDEEKEMYAAQEVRARRDTLLAACDWTALSDCPLSGAKKSEYEIYRQALRDVSEQPEFPFTIAWPVKPE